MRLTRLTLTNFRNYATLTWRPAPHISVITGPNGSGKTNLLEAISLLAPGRGLRAARIADLPRIGAPGAWGINGHLVTSDQPHEIGTGSPPDGPPGRLGDRRIFRLDGAPPRNQAEIAAVASCVWLTPQMDRLFQESASGRRRFLDRLVWALEPGHAREIAAYDTAMAGRNRLLAQGHPDQAWLAALEDSMARHAVAATAARASLVTRLNATLAAGAANPFPAARLVLQDPFAAHLASVPALSVEDELRAALAQSRPKDAAAGAATTGAHRADMLIEDAITGQPAKLASTGQQKALLIGTILGHAALIASARGAAPLLLLDEPAVHLDAERRAALWSALSTGPAQAILTGTDRDPFHALTATAAFWRTSQATLTEQ